MKHWPYKLISLLTLCYLTADANNETKQQSINYTQQEIAQKLDWVTSDDSGNLCRGYYQQPESITNVSVLTAPDTTPTEIHADGSTTLSSDGTTTLNDNVVFTQPGRIVNADKAIIHRDKTTKKINHITLIGNVVIREPDSISAASYAEIDLDTNFTSIDNAIFHQTEAGDNSNLWGTAKHSERYSDETSKLQHTQMSLCSPENPFWKIRASSAKIDEHKVFASAYNATLWVKGIPVLYTPYINFPIKDKRKTGILAPSFLFSHNSGTGYSLPFYWNLAPNYDDVITPTWFTQRGLQIRNSFRLLTDSSTSTFYLSMIPDDLLFNDFKNEMINKYSDSQPEYTEELANSSNTRGYVSFQNSIKLGQRWSTSFNLNYVSDPYYYYDLESAFSLTDSYLLPNSWTTTHSSTHWNESILFSGYQTLHLLEEGSGTEQYRHLPEVNIKGKYNDLPQDLTLNIDSQFVNFDYQSDDFAPYSYQVNTGQRAHIRPTITRNFTVPSGYIAPSFAIDALAFNTTLPGSTADSPQATTSTEQALPIFNIDSGLFFQRPIHLIHHSFIQTLEPRLYYLYIPYKDQTDNPVYDTSIEPFSYSSLFSTNGFSGIDRLQNANQVSFGLFSRLLNDTASDEKIEAGIGITDYLTPQKVCLSSSCTANNDTTSPLTEEISIFPLKNLRTTFSSSWDVNESTLKLASLSTKYAAFNNRSIIDVDYSYIQDYNDNSGTSFPDANILKIGSAQPINDHWSTLGYWYHNLSSDATNDDTYFVGLQYQSCCSALRFIATKDNLYNENNYTYFIQFQLTGLGNFSNDDPSAMITTALPEFYDIFDQGRTINGAMNES